jgi:phosphoribosylamine--glycine ligase
VLKADGLAAGKGVLILDNIEQARAELRTMIDGKFGKAGKTVVIEEFLKGIEVSVFAASDGESYLMLPEAKDYKRIGEGDSGLNTGGMGAVSPVPFADKSFMKKVEEKIVIPTIEGLKRDGMKYKGFIFFGIMNVDGEPYLIEYNVRMGDPETEVVLPRIKTDFVDLLEAIALEQLDQLIMEIDERKACTVMLVSKGYPGNYEKEKVIKGLEKVDGSIVFHAGTKNLNGEVVTNGGRVMAVTTVAGNMSDALKISYKNIKKIDFQGMNYRTDIGFDI